MYVHVKVETVVPVCLLKSFQCFLKPRVTIFLDFYCGLAQPLQELDYQSILPEV